MESPRVWNIFQKFPKDRIQCIEDLKLDKIKLLTSPSIFKKAKRVEVKTSTVLSTQVYPDDNCISGFYRAVKGL